MGFPSMPLNRREAVLINVGTLFLSERLRLNTTRFHALSVLRLYHCGRWSDIRRAKGIRRNTETRTRICVSCGYRFNDYVLPRKNIHNSKPTYRLYAPGITVLHRLFLLCRSPVPPPDLSNKTEKDDGRHPIPF